MRENDADSRAVNPFAKGKPGLATARIFGVNRGVGSDYISEWAGLENADLGSE